MATTPTINSWVNRPKPNSQANLRLFCFPYAGSSAFIFRMWPDSLPTTVEVCPIELPGRGTRLIEPQFNRLSPLIQALAPSILPYLDKPFAFFGHSMGGLVSFELTRLLRRNYSMSPIHLFISGCRAPHLPALDRPIHPLSEPAFLKELRCLNGTPDAVLENTELMQLLLPALRSDFAVVETYVYAPESPLDCPITAFGGLQDRKVICDYLEAWREQTNATFSLKMLPGDHFFLHSAQSLLLKSLGRELDLIVGMIS